MRSAALLNGRNIKEPDDDDDDDRLESIVLSLYIYIYMISKIIHAF